MIYNNLHTAYKSKQTAEKKKRVRFAGKSEYAKPGSPHKLFAGLDVPCSSSARAFFEYRRSFSSEKYETYLFCQSMFYANEPPCTMLVP